MSRYKMSLIGLERYERENGRSLFSNMVIPEEIDRNLMIDNIIMQAEEKELLYSDPDYLRYAIATWSRKNYWTFDKWVKAINIKYDPLNNYDRTEEWTDDHTGQNSRKKESEFENNGHDVTSSNAEDLREDNTSLQTIYNTNVNVDQTVENKESAYNESTYTNKEKTDTDSDTKTTGDTVQRNTGYTRDVSSANSDMTRKDSGFTKDNENGEDIYQNIHTGHISGNIGVTTSQQMLQSELDIAKWNLYDQISDLFISEFCILVY